MKRWHTDKRIMLRRRKVEKLMNHINLSQRPLNTLGRNRKLHPLDCGKKDCKLCHYEKIWDFKSHKDNLADLNWKEQNDEIQ